MNEKSAGDILYRYLEHIYGKTGKKFSDMFRSWENIAGEKLSGHTRIRDFHKGTVLIEADHPAWLQLIQMEQKTILTRLKKAFPELGILRLRAIVSSTPKNEGPADGRSGKEKNPEGIPDKKEFDTLMARLKKSISRENDKK